MKHQLLILAASLATIGFQSTSSAQNITPLRSADGYEGRIKLAATLDDPRGYCLDVPGPASNILLHIPVWTHSCHSGPEPDQVFKFNLDGKGKFRFVYQSYDLCLTAADRVARSRFRYEECNADALQGFGARQDGTIVLKGSNLCLAALNMEAGGSQQETGTGRMVQATHMVRGLTLRRCGSGAPELERWVAIVE